MMRPLILSVCMAVSGTCLSQTVIPLMNFADSGQLGISLKLGSDTNAFTYILDTGSAGFFTALGTNAAWNGAVAASNITATTFDVSYGTGSLAYQGNVATTAVTLTDINGTPLLVSNAQMGVITNEPYAGWNTNINETVPVAPESPTTHQFFGTVGAGLNQLVSNQGSLSSLLGQISLPAGISQGFVIHTGGSNGLATLTIGLSDAMRSSFATLISMNSSTGIATNVNGTTVNLYPQAQTTAQYTLSMVGQSNFQTNGKLIMDTGGLGTHLTTGTDFPSNSVAPFTDVSGNAISTNAAFAVTAAAASASNSALNWSWNAGSTKYVDQIGVVQGSSTGSLNSGIALFYQYDVMFDTQNGVIGLMAVPEPGAFRLLAAGMFLLMGCRYLSRRHCRTRRGR